MCDSVTQVIEGYIMPRGAQESTPVPVPVPLLPAPSSSFPSLPSSLSSTSNPSAISSTSTLSTSSSSLRNVVPGTVSVIAAAASSSSTPGSYDRRARSMKFEAECQMTSEVSSLTHNT